MSEEAKEQQQQITLCGSFGLGNIGDEALPFAFSDLARAHDFSVKVNLLSRYDDPFLRSSIGLSHEAEQRQQSLAGQPCLLIGGGAVAPSRTSVLFRCAPVLKRIHPSYFALFAISVEAGLPYNCMTRMRIRMLLHDAQAPLTVRDDLSAEILQQIMPRRQVEVVGDTVLWMKPEHRLPVKLPRQYIAVSLTSRWSDRPGWYAWIAEQLHKVAARLKVPLVFLPFSWLIDDDRPEHRRVCEVLQFLHPEISAHCIDNVLAPRQMLGIIDGATLTIGMRLHACVMSYARRVPFVALAYHPKLYGFARTVGWERYIIPASVPLRQSTGRYGYAFSHVKTEEHLDLLAAEAMRNGSFSRLDDLRCRSARFFLRLMQLNQMQAAPETASRPPFSL